MRRSTASPCRPPHDSKSGPGTAKSFRGPGWSAGRPAGPGHTAPPQNIAGTVRSLIGNQSDHDAIQVFNGHHPRKLTPLGGWPQFGSTVAKIKGPVDRATPPAEPTAVLGAFSLSVAELGGGLAAALALAVLLGAGTRREVRQ